MPIERLKSFSGPHWSFTRLLGEKINEIVDAVNKIHEDNKPAWLKQVEAYEKKENIRKEMKEQLFREAEEGKLFRLKGDGYIAAYDQYFEQVKI